MPCGCCAGWARSSGSRRWPCRSRPAGSSAAGRMAGSCSRSGWAPNASGCTARGAKRHTGPTPWAARGPEFALRPAQTLWLGPGHHVVTYPISAGRYVNLAAFAPAHDWHVESWTAEGSVDDLRAEFAGWGAPLISLLAG